jgi:hypothetical protein
MIRRADGVIVDSPVHVWFGLTYSAYFVMPRLALQALPLEWQERFVALMNEANDMGLETPEYSVHRRDERGRFFKDPWANYRRGIAAECDPSFATLSKIVTARALAPQKALPPASRAPGGA